MKFTTHPFKSDLLILTKADLKRISEGEEISVSALTIRMEAEPKPDVVLYRKIKATRFPDAGCSTGLVSCTSELPANVELLFDGETGELKEIGLL